MLLERERKNINPRKSMQQLKKKKNDEVPRCTMGYGRGKNPMGNVIYVYFKCSL